MRKKIKDNWGNICNKLGYKPKDIPGRRTIYDVACVINKRLFGFDIKTKDLDSDKYSDGGVCAIGNLLKFLANDNGIFILVEFSHKKSNNKNNKRVIKHIKIAPFHCLPKEIYRIENLGTGQIRLNDTIAKVWKKIKWNRTNKQFFNMFCKLAIKHYKRVQADAEKRIKSIEKFKENGYQKFQFVQ